MKLAMATVRVEHQRSTMAPVHGGEYGAVGDAYKRDVIGYRHKNCECCLDLAAGLEPTFGRYPLS
jgi:hypothetical protein